MQITINTGEMSAQDAAGLIALLGLQFPEALSVLEAAGIAVADNAAGNHRGGPASTDPATAFGEPSAQLAFGRPDVSTAEVISAGEPVGSAGNAGNAAASEEPAPAGTSAPVAPVAVSGDVDADGIPWDARIHSEGHAKTKDGKWRLKRGVDEATRTKVVAELKAAMGAAPVPPAAAPPPSPAQSAPVPSVTETAGSSASPAAPPPPAAPIPEAPAAPPPPPAETPAPPPAPTAADGVQAFGAIMRKVTEAQTGGKITAAETTSLAAQVGLESVRGLLARPDLIPAFDELFTAYVAA